MGEVAIPHSPLLNQFNSIPIVDSTNRSLPEKEKKEDATEAETTHRQKDSISTVDSIGFPLAEKDQKTELVILPEHLPKPEAPPGLLTKTNSISHEEYHPIKRSTSAQMPSSVDMASIGRYIRDRSDVVSAAIARRISSLKENTNGPSITEIHLPDVKVIVKPPGKNPSTYTSMKGRVSFFSRSGCRDCTAVRSFFREIELPYVEINVDVFPEREKELFDRAGTNQVPQIFLNEKHLGGLVVLNSLRNSGEFDKVLKSMTGKKCSDEAPRVPVYGFDHEEADKENLDEMVGIVAVLRSRLPMQDRFVRMKLVRNCFTGAEMVDAITQHLNLDRAKVSTFSLVKFIFRLNAIKLL
jgi:glutaredoxin